MSNEITLAWEDPAAVTSELSAFMASVISADNRYISHGEIQGGLSPDGKHWAPDLEQLFREDIAEIAGERSLLVARSAGGIAGAAIVLWDFSDRCRYAVIEDMAVSPEFRSAGIGAMLMERIETEATARQSDWLFLESGKDNLGAHRFFERHGFSELSHVFSRRLKPGG